MNKYLIVLTSEGEGSATVIEEQFPDHRYELLPGKVWAVAVEDNKVTASDICNQIGLGTGDNERVGVVIPFRGYYGYADAALWQRFAVWDKHDPA
ncbi:MAG: hypothetical protein OXQ86_04810 [Gammaproteobacteria bacterium]|nr:hypothetical protein [Gammaproteobacteria bacterium]MDE0413495.1 hypothetical protein [Gammaproteobacteria bacterium]